MQTIGNVARGVQLARAVDATNSRKGACGVSV